MERTGAVLDDVSNYLLKDEAKTVDATFIVNGFNYAGRGQSQGQVFVRLKDWRQRTSADLSAKALISRISEHFSSYKDATIIPVRPRADDQGVALDRGSIDSVAQGPAAVPGQPDDAREPDDAGHV
jgi:multidrug efflux pump subunit AcrB